MRVSTLTFCLFSMAAAVFGQSGSISGTVVDPNGIVVANAPVQAKGAGGSMHKAVTSAKGAYKLADLPPGSYEISVTVPAVRPYRRNVSVEASKTLPLEIRLEDTTQLSTLGEDRISATYDLNRHAPPSGPAPRLANGKPDFSGVWWTPNTVDPGKPEFLAAAQATAKQRTENERRDSPQSHCLPGAVLRLGPVYEIVQSPQMIIEVSDDDYPGFHQIYTDGRSHPEDPNPAWYGHSVGHWDGDTLVVDRVAFDDRVWLDQEAHPHGKKLHVIERYRRPDMGHLETEITVEDPSILAKPFTTKRVSDLAPTEEIHEFICNENERDVAHFYK